MLFRRSLMIDRYKLEFFGAYLVENDFDFDYFVPIDSEFDFIILHIAYTAETAELLELTLNAANAASLIMLN